MKASKARNPAVKIKLVEIDHYAGQGTSVNTYRQNELRVNPDGVGSPMPYSKNNYDV
jgi:hypothetical protein